jgi:hypothetical protein
MIVMLMYGISYSSFEHISSGLVALKMAHRTLVQVSRVTFYAGEATLREVSARRQGAGPSIGKGETCRCSTTARAHPQQLPVARRTVAPMQVAGQHGRPTQPRRPTCFRQAHMAPMYPALAPPALLNRRRQSARLCKRRWRRSLPCWRTSTRRTSMAAPRCLTACPTERTMNLTARCSASPATPPSALGTAGAHMQDQSWHGHARAGATLALLKALMVLPHGSAVSSASLPATAAPRDDKCLRSDSENCAPEGSRWYAVTHAGIDPMTRRLVDEGRLLALDNPALIMPDDSNTR